MNKSSMSHLSPATEQDGKKNAIVDQAKQAVSHVVSDVAGQARDQANAEFDTRKDKAVETIGNVASAIRETSEKLKGVGPLGDVAGRAADGIDSVAHFFEGKQITDIARDVERFARREPALFLGAAFAVGLIGGRFLKSSGHREGRGMQSSGEARQGGLGSDRYNAPYGASYGASWGDGGYDDGFLSDDDLQDAMESKRFTSNESPPTGRATLPLSTRTVPASTPTTPAPTASATPGAVSNGNGNGTGNSNSGRV